MCSLKKLYLTFVFLMICGLSFFPAQAQSVKPASINCFETGTQLNDWINCKLRELVMARVNQRAVNKQVQTPSIADSTTSLVDQTDAPDIVGLAFNLTGLNKGSDDTDKSDTSFTSSAYAIYAAATRNDPLDPTFYRKHSQLRNFSFTFGRESADANNTTDQKSATIAGFKVRLINKRDATSDDNNKLLNQVADELQKATPAFGNTRQEIIDFLYDELASNVTPRPDKPTFIATNLTNSSTFIAIVKSLTSQQQTEINRIINRRINSHVTLSETKQKVIETIRRQPQLSFSFQSKLRPGNGNDEYRTGLLFDMGIANRLNFAVNGTFDYKDSKTIGGDTRGGRIASEFYYQFTGDKNLFTGKDPFLLSFSGEGKWMTGKGPTYQAQTKLTIPIFDGINLPVSVTYANRKDLIKESKIRGNFGITFDLAKALKGFRPN